MFKTNEYFDGKVKSIAFEDSDGPATIGVMAAGDYDFGTSTREVMQVVSGHLDIKLPGTTDWQRFGAGDSFEVAADVSFAVRVETDSSYLCRYG